MAEAGLEELRANRIDSVVVTEYERALLMIARGRVARPECNAMIEKRLAELQQLQMPMPAVRPPKET